MPSIEELRRRAAKAREARKKKARIRERVAEAVKRLGENIKGLARRIARKVRRRERREDRRIVLSAGAPHWGGSDDILRLEVEPIAAKVGLHPNSAKRTESYGNPTSDHHTSQVNASARDFPTVENHALLDQIAKAVVGRAVSDYENVYFKREGVTFRFQGIAGTHGTGPHLHIGIRRA